MSFSGLFLGGARAAAFSDYYFFHSFAFLTYSLILLASSSSAA
jgi:hypothetical protein